MIPRWKLKRELVRLRDHLVGLPQTIASLPARLSEPQRRRAHDAAFPNNMHLTKGRIELGKRLAVVVLFQPRGIAPSTIETCQGLVAGGYTPPRNLQCCVVCQGSGIACRNLLACGRATEFWL